MLAHVFLMDGQKVHVPITQETDTQGQEVLWAHLPNGQTVHILPLALEMIYGEVVLIPRRVRDQGHEETMLSTILTPEAYRTHVAYLFPSEEEEGISCLYDPTIRRWREMTEEEERQDRLGWEGDQRDIQQIDREWREYRNEGLGERG